MPQPVTKEQATVLIHGRQPEVGLFPFNLSSHYHVYIVYKFKKYLFTHEFENLEEATVLACEMCTSGFGLWPRNVACLMSVLAENASGDYENRWNILIWLFYLRGLRGTMSMAGSSVHWDEVFEAIQPINLSHKPFLCSCYWWCYMEWCQVLCALLSVANTYQIFSHGNFQ